MSQKRKNITLRFNEDIYDQISLFAKAENRSVSNFLETFFLKKINESAFVDDEEMAEILADKDLLKRMQEGMEDAKARRGKFV